MDLHTIKCDPEPFKALVIGSKVHEVRVFDRDYKVGDILNIVQEKCATENQYSGRIVALVTHITEPGTYGLPKSTGVMSLRVIENLAYLRE